MKPKTTIRSCESGPARQRLLQGSSGWYRSNPLDHPWVKARTAIQLLTHPVLHAPSPRMAEEEIDSLRAERELVICRGLSDATAKAKALSNGGGR
jgi:hypothetical protein